MAQQTIIGYFDNRTAAENARDALTDAGVASSAIRMLPEAGTGTDYTRSTTETDYNTREDRGGFWASLADVFLPDEDRTAYAEGMSRGGVMLSVTADDADYDRVTDILEEYGSVDLDQQETQWKSEGWHGTSSESATSGAAGLAGGTSSAGASMGRSTTASTTGSSFGDAGYAARSSATGDEEVIPVVEEQLRVGKRQVDKGRVRIRSYVVETPVEEQVSLHSERVILERRPVDRALSGNEAAFTDRVIEAEERREEAVVSKEARIKEEISLRREAEERTETVSDTVRRTEVEIEDERVEAEKLEADRLRGTKPLAS